MPNSFEFKMRLAIACIFTICYMTAFESVKHLLFPDISIWESHIITILFTSVMSTALAYLMFAKIDDMKLKTEDALVAAREAEEKSRVKEEYLRVALHSAQMGIWSWEVKTGKVVWSPEVEKIFGYEPGKFPGTYDAVIEMVHPDDRVAVRKKIEDCLKNPELPYASEYRVIRHSGQIRWVEAIGNVHRDENQVALSMTGTVYDATDKVFLRNALSKIVEGTPKTGQAYFESLVKSLSDTLNADSVLVAETLPDGKKARSIAVWSDGKPAPLSVFDLPGSPCESVLSTGLLLQKQGIRDLYPGDGMLRDCNANGYVGVALTSSAGQKIGVLAVMHRGALLDGQQPEQVLRIFAARASSELERRRADEALRNSEARLNAIIENTPNVAIQGADVNGKILFWNKASEKMFGHTSLDAMGKDIATVLPMDGSGRFQAALQEVRSEPLRFVGPLELEFKHTDGQNGRCLTTIFAIYSTRGEITLISMSVDFTAHEEMENKLRHAQKMESMGRLAGGVAHDFNNLLTGILGYSELILSNPIPHPRKHNVDDIRRIALRAGKLTRQLLAFSRQQVFTPEVLDLNSVVLEMEKMLKRIIGDQVLFHVEPFTRPVKIEADSSQLEQVVLNLVVNARDAMQGSGRITVSIKSTKIDDPRPFKGFSAQPGEYAVLTVADAGHGMNAEVLERIFEPYFTTKGEGKGTGLGLSMVYGIVKKSGGFITVNTKVGKGTEFHVHLPVVASEREAVGARSEVQVNPKGNETILIVDDDPMTLEVVTSGLREYGYSILSANSATQGFALAQSNPGRIQLLLTDVVMPGTNGYALAKMVKSLHPEIQILFMSGYTDDDMLRSGVSEGRINFIEKPFAPYQLAEKIRVVLNSNAHVNGVAAK